MDYEWNEDKNRFNLAKHGIDFADAIRVFDGPTVEYMDDRTDYGEPRFIALGSVHSAEIVVVYTLRQGRIRIISARKATRNERQKYREIFK
ncbi:MAG TPA: BrnT family toxin [bacterium]|nr:BrnT family toxin [bacterium]HPO07356.1 BrnT family toxin [bacterium]HQO33682.1 BrnT family toxin [bacterium]HQQ00064.1 BrnT family toxin [bacterium]